MKKMVLLLGVLCLLIILNGCKKQQEAVETKTKPKTLISTEESTEPILAKDQKTTKEQSVEKSETANDRIVYENEEYGFSLAFPETWKTYQANKNSANFGNSNVDSIHFEFKKNEPLFSIYVFTNEQWRKINGDNDDFMLSRKLGSNDQYVFMFEQAQDVYPSFQGRFGDVDEVIKTFELIK